MHSGSGVAIAFCACLRYICGSVNHLSTHKEIAMQDGRMDIVIEYCAT